MKMIALQTERHDGAVDDSDLVRASRRGDRQAFDALVGRHDGELRRFLSRRLAGHEIDDVCQDTWIAAWASLHRFDGRCRFRTWLFGISLMKVKDHYRSVAREQMRLPRETTDDQIHYEDDNFEHAELQETVKQILADLTPSQREMLSLYYDAELTLPEIASVLDRNLNTVKYQFYRAHAVAADYVDKHGDASMRPTSWLRRKP